MHTQQSGDTDGEAKQEVLLKVKVSWIFLGYAILAFVHM